MRLLKFRSASLAHMVRGSTDLAILASYHATLSPESPGALCGTGAFNCRTIAIPRALKTLQEIVDPSAAPFVFIFFTSLKSVADVAQTSAFALPDSLKWENCVNAWARGEFDTTVVNSAVITVIKVRLGLLFRLWRPIRWRASKSQGSASSTFWSSSGL